MRHHYMNSERHAAGELGIGAQGKNQLSGRLPDAMAALSQLSTLVVSRNLLRGVLPNGIFRMTQLEDLSAGSKITAVHN